MYGVKRRCPPSSMCGHCSAKRRFLCIVAVIRWRVVCGGERVRMHRKKGPVVGNERFWHCHRTVRVHYWSIALSLFHLSIGYNAKEMSRRHMYGLFSQCKIEVPRDLSMRSIGRGAFTHKMVPKPNDRVHLKYSRPSVFRLIDQMRQNRLLYFMCHKSYLITDIQVPKE